METQEKIWDDIAKEWHKFKLTPSESATEFLNNQRGKIVDFGSGSGRNLLGIKKDKNKKLFLVDFSEKMLALAKRRGKKLDIKINTTKSDLEKTPFEDEFFDAGICASSLHCIETKEKRENAIKELYRILKKGAKAEIEVWNKNSNRFKKKEKENFIGWRDKGKRYYYLYEPEEIYEEFRKAGFKVIKKIPHNANIIFIVERV